jgi:hypothetical protein
LFPKYTFNGNGLSIRPKTVWEDDVALRDSEIPEDSWDKASKYINRQPLVLESWKGLKGEKNSSDEVYIHLTEPVRLRYGIATRPCGDLTKESFQRLRKPLKQQLAEFSSHRQRRKIAKATGPNGKSRAARGSRNKALSLVEGPSTSKTGETEAAGRADGSDTPS